MGERRRRHHRRSHRQLFNSSKCDFCGGNFDGLSHKCKYCGETHCSKHLLPENHNCRGLSQPKSFGEIIKNRSSNYRYKEHSMSLPISNENYSSKYYDHRSHNGKQRRDWRLPKIRIPRVSKFVKALIIAVVTFYAAYKFTQYSFLLWLEAAAWIYLAFVIYKKAFRWANRVNMGNDLAFFGLRLLGGAIVIFGVYLGLAGLLATFLTPNSAYQAIPLFAFLGGAMLLGLFIAFRTNRRHHVVGVWRA